MYLNGITPEDYKCRECGATGIKLWREYNTFNPRLLCASHAAKGQGKDIGILTPEGKWLDPIVDQWCDQIGWYVPAVPTEDGIGYWGYTSVPDAGVEWWKGLPNGEQK